MSNIEIITPKKLSDIFAALSNPYRLAIFMRLSCCGDEMKDANSEGQICECVGSLGKDLDIAPSTVSHHLKELAHAGLITMNRRGQTTECSIDPKVVKAVAGFFKQSSCSCAKEK
jgi:ArsR family transcriptional regulator, arsenate/arsenite/antimonite-responsive transcriptional repressor